MSEQATHAALPGGDTPLAWECLSEHQAGPAFRQTLAELLFHPVRFFRRMAVTGGLHEPIAFFAIILAVGVLLALPAALAYVGLTAPPPTGESVEAYAAARAPARVAVLAAVLLPLVLVAGCAAMVLLGSLFHAGSKVFAAGHWEGSVSVWFYSVGAMLTPLVIWIVAVGAVSLVGYLLGVAWPAVRGPAAGFAQWTLLIVGAAAVLASAGLLTSGCAIGRTQAFGLDPLLGAASGLLGLALAVLVVVGNAWCFMRHGAAWGLACTGLCALAGAAVAFGAMAASRRVEGSA